MGRYDFEEELSDNDGDDDFLQDEIRALSMACMPQPPSTTSASDGGTTANPSAKEFSDDNDEDDDDDDLELVRSIKEQYGYGDDITQPMSLKPLTALPPVLSDDDDDDFETLRAIQRRFSQYCGSGGGGGAPGDDDEMASKDDKSVDKSFHKSDGVGTSLGSEFLDVHRDDFRHDNCDTAEDFENMDSCTSSFPMSAQTFMEAIKKNRSSQKFIRNKMLHIEARMEEIKDIQKRLKTLRDFQVQCKKKIGRALSQKQDARVQLISAAKQKANTKGEKNVSAMFYGPSENSHVALYKTTMENFPLSFHREKWSKAEKQLLNKEINNQFQKSLFNKSADAISAIEESGFDNGVDGMMLSIKNLDITSEIIQDFVGKVDWNQLASVFPRRSGEECEARWLNNENCLINRDNWTYDEDKHLLLLIQKNGIHNWSYIAEKLETNRTPFQCLARYQRSLNASILKRDWTEDEDAQLRCAVDSFGESNWQAVASLLEGRTGTQCSNRWNKTLLPARQRVGTWSISEDKRLKVAVTLFGHKSWHRIASFVPGRTQAQCRERWVNVLDPSLNRGQWTEEDDMRLKKAIQEHGHCWSKVAVCVPLRTDNQCRRRWKRLFPDDMLRLKAAKDIKKAALISNFVDRESERPTLGANDFVPLRITDSTNRQENENVTQEQGKSRSRCRKSRKEDPTGVSRCSPKEIRSRKHKKGDELTEYINDCDDARSKNGKRRATRIGSKERSQNRSRCIATEHNNSYESPELHDNRELKTMNIPIRTRSSRPRGVRSKEMPPISHCGGSQATGIHGTDMNVATLVHSSSQDNLPEMLDRQSTSSDLQLSIHDEKVEMSNIVTKTKKKRYSKLQPRRSRSSLTILGDNNCEAMELRTFDDVDETHPMDAACSIKENAVKKQKKGRLHPDQSVEWENLPLSVLFRRNVTRIQRNIPS